MSSENKFHKTIEQGNAEEKKILWERIQSRNVYEREDVGEVLVKNKPTRKIFIIIPAIFIAVVGIFLIVCRFTIWKPRDKFRYCSVGDYYTTEEDITIKQYCAAVGKDLLYFDWYDTTEYYYDKQFKLNGTDELICLQEDIVSNDGAYISLYITDKYTKLDFISLYANNCVDTVTVKSVNVKWAVSVDYKNLYAHFTYNDYFYFLNIEGYNGQIEYLLSNLIN